MQKYDEKVEQPMRLFYDSLSEKGRRRYAAVEAEELGHGSIEYVAQVAALPSFDGATRTSRYRSTARRCDTRTRAKKRGRKSCLDSMPELESKQLDESLGGTEDEVGRTDTNESLNRSEELRKRYISAQSTRMKSMSKKLPRDLSCEHSEHFREAHSARSENPMPEWKQKHELDPNTRDQNQYTDGDPYTNLEKHLNGTNPHVTD